MKPLTRTLTEKQFANLKAGRDKHCEQIKSIAGSMKIEAAMHADLNGYAAAVELEECADALLAVVDRLKEAV